MSCVKSSGPYWIRLCPEVGVQTAVSLSGPTRRATARVQTPALRHGDRVRHGVAVERYWNVVLRQPGSIISEVCHEDYRRCTAAH